MPELLTQVFSGLVGGASAAFILGYFFKRLINEYDTKHKKAEETLEEVREQYHQLDKKLIAIGANVEKAVNIRNDFKDVEKNIWKLDSQVKAAWKVLDKKRSSDG